MKVLSLLVVITFLFFRGDCLHCLFHPRKCRRRSTASPTEISRRIPFNTALPNHSATINCKQTHKCVNFSEVSRAIPQLLQCAPFLQESCVSQINLEQLRDVISNKWTEIADFLRGFENRDCDCQNRSIEFFCRFVLPRCSISNLPVGNCDAPTCSDSKTQMPCFNYCKSLTQNCFYARELSSVNKIFQSFNQNNISDVCEVLDNQQPCWKNAEANFTGCIPDGIIASNTSIQSSSLSPPSVKYDHVLVVALGVPALVLFVIVVVTVGKRCRTKRKIPKNEVVSHNCSYSESVTVVKRVKSSDSAPTCGNECNCYTPYTFADQVTGGVVHSFNPYVDMSGKTSSKENLQLPEVDYIKIDSPYHLADEPYVNFHHMCGEVTEAENQNVYS